MKLFLSSIGIPEKYNSQFCKLVGKSFDEIKMIFCPTAADPYKNKWFVDEDRKSFEKVGMEIKELDLKDYVDKEIKLENNLDWGDVIYFSGGNSFYLNYWMREVGFKEVMLRLFKKGKVYAGGSAGAVVAGSSIAPVEFLDHPEEVPIRIDEGLNFIDYSILPHWGYEKYDEDYKLVMNRYGDDKRFKLMRLANDEAIVVDN